MQLQRNNFVAKNHYSTVYGFIVYILKPYTIIVILKLFDD